MRNTLIILLWVIALPVAEMSYEFFAVRPVVTKPMTADLAVVKASLPVPQAIWDKNGVVIAYKDGQGHVYYKGHYPVMPDDGKPLSQANELRK